MPIVIERKTGKVIQGEKFTQEQSNRAWAIIVEAYARQHPEILFKDCPQAAGT